MTQTDLFGHTPQKEMKGTHPLPGSIVAIIGEIKVYQPCGKCGSGRYGDDEFAYADANCVACGGVTIEIDH